MNFHHSDFLYTSANDTRSHLLATGYQLIAHKGFTAVGIKQILDTAGIPKGSFYYYFASKEAFGEAIIKGYFEHYKHRLKAIPKTTNLAAESIAKRWYYAWLGASLIAKTSRSDSSLSEVWQMTISELGYPS